MKEIEVTKNRAYRKTNELNGEEKANLKRLNGQMPLKHVLGAIHENT